MENKEASSHDACVHHWLYMVKATMYTNGQTLDHFITFSGVVEK